jgi:hypothetical protein
LENPLFFNASINPERNFPAAASEDVPNSSNYLANSLISIFSGAVFNTCHNCLASSSLILKVVYKFFKACSTLVTLFPTVTILAVSLIRSWNSVASYYAATVPFSKGPAALIVFTADSNIYAEVALFSYAAAVSLMFWSKAVFTLLPILSFAANASEALLTVINYFAYSTSYEAFKAASAS